MSGCLFLKPFPGLFSFCLFVFFPQCVSFCFVIFILQAYLFSTERQNVRIGGEELEGVEGGEKEMYFH